MRQGLAPARKVLVIADGAVWIWNLAADRFAGARQRLDPWPALQHLWAVAHALHPEDEAAAAAGIAPWKEKRLASRAVEIIQVLDKVLSRLRGPRRATVQTERNDWENHRERLDYHGVKERGEPAGSGARASTCKQDQLPVSPVGTVLDAGWRRGVEVSGNLPAQRALVVAVSACASRF
jgi:hypothetical protein